MIYCNICGRPYRPALQKFEPLQADRLRCFKCGGMFRSFDGWGPANPFVRIIGDGKASWAAFIQERNERAFAKLVGDAPLTTRRNSRGESRAGVSLPVTPEVRRLCEHVPEGQLTS